MNELLLQSYLKKGISKSAQEDIIKDQRKISRKFSPKVIHLLPYDYHTIFTQNYSKLTFIKQICLRLELELAI